MLLTFCFIQLLSTLNGANSTAKQEAVKLTQYTEVEVILVRRLRVVDLGAKQIVGSLMHLTNMANKTLMASYRVLWNTYMLK